MVNGNKIGTPFEHVVDNSSGWLQAKGRTLHGLVWLAADKGPCNPVIQGSINHRFIIPRLCLLSFYFDRSKTEDIFLGIT